MIADNKLNNLPVLINAECSIKKYSYILTQVALLIISISAAYTYKSMTISLP